MRKRKNPKRRRESLFTLLSNKIAASEKNIKDLPPFFRRRLQAFNVGIASFIIFGIISLIMTKRVYTLVFGIILALCILVLRYLEVKRFSEKGFETWRLEVLEHIYSKRPYSNKVMGLYAEALSGPYAGKTCHISLIGAGPVPPEGRDIDISVPGDLSILPIRDIYYIPQYYGLELSGKSDGVTAI